MTNYKLPIVISSLTGVITCIDKSKNVCRMSLTIVIGHIQLYNLTAR